MAIPNLWRTKKQRYSLQGDVCVHCERAVFPPREVCPHCHKPMSGYTAGHALAPAAAKPAASSLPFALTAPAQPALVAVVGDD